MTEDEAKAKVCCGPPAVAIAQLAAAVGRDVNIGCQASVCMAWRWDRAASAVELNKQAQTGVATAPIGYCGLAGAPQ